MELQEGDLTPVLSFLPHWSKPPSRGKKLYFRTGMAVSTAASREQGHGLTRLHIYIVTVCAYMGDREVVVISTDSS